MVRAISNAIFPIVLACFTVVFGHCNSGCKPPNAAQAEAQYTAELLSCVAEGNRCVEAGHTKAECSEGVRECRKAVNTKWGLCPDAEWPYLNPCDQ